VTDWQKDRCRHKRPCYYAARAWQMRKGCKRSRVPGGSKLKEQEAVEGRLAEVASQQERYTAHTARGSAHWNIIRIRLISLQELLQPRNLGHTPHRNLERRNPASCILTTDGLMQFQA
jgi:hypothetical protein